MVHERIVIMRRHLSVVIDLRRHLSVMINFVVSFVEVIHRVESRFVWWRIHKDAAHWLST